MAFVDNRYIFDVYMEHYDRFYTDEVRDTSFNSAFRQIVNRLYGQAAQISGFLNTISSLAKVEITNGQNINMGAVFINCCFEKMNMPEDTEIIKRLPFIPARVLALPMESCPMQKMFHIATKANIKKHFSSECQALQTFMLNFLKKYPFNMTFLERSYPVISEESYNSMVKVATIVQKQEWKNFRFKPMINKCVELMNEARSKNYLRGYSLRQCSLFTGEILLLLEKIGKGPKAFMFTGEDGKPFGISVKHNRALIDAEILLNILREAQPLYEEAQSE